MNVDATMVHVRRTLFHQIRKLLVNQVIVKMNLIGIFYKVAKF